MQQEFELCAETLQACVAAEAGGADRIELCAALNEGGVTPGHGFLHEALRATSLPVHVLLRPRSGNFVYSTAEFRMISADMEHAFAAGAAGVVLGLLTSDAEIDLQRTRGLVHQAQGRAVTFHRAFDMLHDQQSALEQLIDLGCSRVLTSGGKPTVSEGREALVALAAQSAGRIRIAAGGGITVANAASFAATGSLDLHASLRRKAAGIAGDPLWHTDEATVSADDVRAISRLLHS